MIELAGVRLERPRAAAPLFDGVDLVIHRGDVVLVSGCAGAGTSTLIAALTGDVAPAEGTVSLFGRDLARLRRSSLLALRRRLGVIPQDLQLLPECTALANVELPLEIDHVPRRDAGLRAATALARLGVAAYARAPIAEIPFAARQRVAVARALVRAPCALLADQPTAHQDAEGAELVADALTEAAALGAAVLVAGRDPHLVAAAARRHWRQLIVHNGRLVDVTELVTMDAVEAAAPEAVPHIEITGALADEIVIDSRAAADEPEIEVVESTDPGPEADIIEFPAAMRSRGAR